MSSIDKLCGSFCKFLYKIILKIAYTKEIDAVLLRVARDNAVSHLFSEVNVLIVWLQKMVFSCYVTINCKAADSITKNLIVQSTKHEFIQAHRCSVFYYCCFAKILSHFE